MKALIRIIIQNIIRYIFISILVPLSLATADEQRNVPPNLNIICQISDSVSFIVKRIEPEYVLVAGYTFRGSELGNFSICTVPPVRPPHQMVLYCEDSNLDHWFRLVFTSSPQGQEFEILLEESSNPNEKTGLLPCFGKN